MNIWVLSGSYEGEQFASSHLTEKGAVLAAIADVLQLLGIEDEDDARQVVGRKNLNQGLMDDEIAFEWDTEKMKSMTREQLWPIFHGWGEFTWDNNNGYNVEVIKTQVRA